jgi:hypothetical protein
MPRKSPGNVEIGFLTCRETLTFKGLRKACKANESARRRAQPKIVSYAHTLHSKAGDSQRRHDAHEDCREVVRASQSLHPAQAAKAPDSLPQRKPSSAATTVDTRQERHDVREFTKVVMRNGFFVD